GNGSCSRKIGSRASQLDNKGLDGRTSCLHLHPVVQIQLERVSCNSYVAYSHHMHLYRHLRVCLFKFVPFFHHLSPHHSGVGNGDVSIPSRFFCYVWILSNGFQHVLVAGFPFLCFLLGILLVLLVQ